MATATTATPIMIDLDRDTAGILQRATAAVIDTCVLLALAMPLLLPWAESLLAALMAADADLFLDALFEYDLPWIRVAGIYLLDFAYAVFMLTRYGRTLGMMALRIRVTDSNGEHISISTAALRTAVYILPQVAAGAAYYWHELPAFLISGIQTIGLLWIMVDRAHQGYHDKIARTLVLHERYYQTRRAPDLSSGS